MTDLAEGAVDVQRFHDAAARRLDDDLTFVAQLVAIDSGGDRPEGIREVESVIVDRLAASGGVPTWHDGAVPHVLVRVHAGHRDAGDAITGVASATKHAIPHAAPRPRRVVLVTHADTVFPAGTASLRPFTRNRDVATGPGVVDMKGGLVLAVCAVELLAMADVRHTAVDVLIVGDEEVRTTPPPFMEELRTADAALVLECGRPGGGFVTARKAGLWACARAIGRAAHSGTSRHEGSNAIEALAAEAVRIAELDGSRADLTISTGMISGGTSINSVPDMAEAWFDVRAHDAEHLCAAAADMRAFGDHPGIAFELVESEHWPAMVPTPPAQRLTALYKALAAELGVPVHEVTTGGMSDGAWLSDAGVPSLDGLGPVGDADHSPHEWMQVSSFPQRAALLAGLLVALETAARNDATHGTDPGTAQDTPHTDNHRNQGEQR